MRMVFVSRKGWGCESRLWRYAARDAGDAYILELERGEELSCEHNPLNPSLLPRLARPRL